MAPVDVALLVLMAITALRGLVIGLTREVLSLLALAALCLALRTVWAPVASWVGGVTGLEGLAARLAAAGLMVGGGLVALVIVGAVVRRLIRASGLGLWDRVGGGVLGIAEGALLAGLLLLLGIVALGRDHPWLAGTRALAAFERLESAASPEAPLRDVAAPPRR